jgi:hypothetical protein
LLRIIDNNVQKGRREGKRHEGLAQLAVFSFKKRVISLTEREKKKNYFLLILFG